MNRILVSVAAITVFFVSVGVRPTAAQFAIRPNQIVANVNIPYTGPVTAMSQSNDFELRALRNEVEYVQLIGQLQAAQYQYQYQDWALAQQQQVWAAQQQATFLAQQQAEFLIQLQQQAEQEARWRAAIPPERAARNGIAPTQKIAIREPSARFALTGSATSKPKRIRITLRVEHDRFGDVFFRAVSVAAVDDSEN